MKTPLTLLPVQGPAVPGIRKTNDSGERMAPTPPRARGSSMIWRELTVPPISEDSVSMAGALDATVTVSVSPPAESVISSEETVPTRTSTPVLSLTLKPALVTVMV